MNRRSFLTAIIATCTAPAIVRADSLMRIVPRQPELHVEDVWVTQQDYSLMTGMIRERVALLNELLREGVIQMPKHDEYGRYVGWPYVKGERVVFRRYVQ